MALHRRAEAAHDRALYQQAIAAYDAYVDEHGDAPAAFEAAFEGAEACYSIEDWRGAAQRYRRAIAIRPNDRRAPEAGYADVIATRHSLGLREGDGDPLCEDHGEDGPVHPEPLSDRARQVLAAYDVYLAMEDESPMRPAIAFRKAQILSSCGRFAEAEPVLAEIVDRRPDSDVAGHAAVLLLDGLGHQEKYAELRRRSAALEAGPLADHPVLRDALRQIHARLGRRRSAEATAGRPPVNSTCCP